MQFTSGLFFIFLPLAALVSWLIPRKVRYIWLLLVSLCFYALAGPTFLLVLAFTIGSTYYAGILVEKRREQLAAEQASENTGAQESNPTGDSVSKFIIGHCIVMNVAIIAVFKYLGMFGFVLPDNWIVPLGISFYILEAISYMIDVYRGKIQAERNVLYYALFVAFFPTIVSGPIERAGNMLPQFKNPPKFEFSAFRDGLLMMLWGYFCKLVLADRIGIVVDHIYGNLDSYRGTVVVLAVILYTFQIYCDFAGYSSIAIGAAKVLGFKVMDNFKSPYMSGTITEFWRRWHISLSSWFRDYLYIPLGGNRKGTLRKYLNVLIVFAVSGLWHGADWSFMVWGLLHGVYQVIGFVLQPVRDGWCRLTGTDRSAASHKILKTIVTFCLAAFAWIFFRAKDLAQSIEIIRRMFLGVQPWNLTDGTLVKLGLDTQNVVLLALGLAVLVAFDAATYHGVNLREWIVKQGLWLRWSVYIGAVVLILVCGIWGPAYDATSFIYSQF